MSNNKAIQFLRGKKDKIKNNTSNLLPGQPLYNMDDNYLTIGNNNGKQIGGNVVVSPLIKGKFSDVGSLIETNANTYDYGVYPTSDDETLNIKAPNIKLKNTTNSIVVDEDININTLNTANIVANEDINITAPNITIGGGDTTEIKLKASNIILTADGSDDANLEDIKSELKIQQNSIS